MWDDVKVRKTGKVGFIAGHLPVELVVQAENGSRVTNAPEKDLELVGNKKGLLQRWKWVVLDAAGALPYPKERNERNDAKKKEEEKGVKPTAASFRKMMTGRPVGPVLETLPPRPILDETSRSGKSTASSKGSTPSMPRASITRTDPPLDRNRKPIRWSCRLHLHDAVSSSMMWNR